MLIRYFLVLFFLNTAFICSWAKADSTESIFSEYANKVVQVRVIERVSKEKASIGSGFYVSEDGLLVSNYHVIASVVSEPDKYRVDLVYKNGDVKKAELIFFDVVHDLALLKAPKSENGYFRILEGDPLNGEKIYSFGNPQNLGLTIVEGNYNGTIQESRLEKLNFSGSLNPGMSGGPSVNGVGKVLGVNVSTAGNQLSFLVPSKFVIAMLQDYSSKGKTDQKSFLSIVEQQLIADQEEKFSSILDANLNTVSLGKLSVPSRLISSHKCWSKAKDKKEEGYDYLNHVCSTSERIFIDSDLNVGSLSLFYLLLKNKSLNEFSFASTVEHFFTEYKKNANGAKQQVTNYNCSKEYVTNSSSTFWINVCMRRYKKMPQLYDLNISASSVDSSDKALLAFTAISAISSKNSTRFVEKFVEALKWNP